MNVTLSPGQMVVVEAEIVEEGPEITVIATDVSGIEGHPRSVAITDT